MSKDKLMVMTYKKFQNSITFFLKDIIYLWQQKDIEKNNISYTDLMKFETEISSTYFIAF